MLQTILHQHGPLGRFPGDFLGTLRTFDPISALDHGEEAPNVNMTRKVAESERLSSEQGLQAHSPNIRLQEISEMKSNFKCDGTEMLLRLSKLGLLHLVANPQDCCYGCRNP
jgi:hypothetical protein